MIGRTEQLTRDVRKMPLFRQLVPQEAGVGWPMPFRKANGVYVTLLFFGYGQDPDSGSTAVYPPFSMVTVDWANWRAMEYLDLRYRHPWPDDQCTARAGTFPHQAVAGLSVAEYRGTSYRDVLRLRRNTRSSGVGNRGSRRSRHAIRERLRVLMEPGLELYYRALSPQFFGRFLPTRASTHAEPIQEAAR